MHSGKMLTSAQEIARHLNAARVIAVVGLSPKPQRDSHRVSAYMQAHGYRIVPVRPAQPAILGETAFSTLDDVSPPVDIICVFRQSRYVMDHARQALRLAPKLFWMQEGITHFEAAMMLNAAGIDVVMDRCIMVDHRRMAMMPTTQAPEEGRSHGIRTP